MSERQIDRQTDRQTVIKQKEITKQTYNQNKKTRTCIQTFLHR